MLQYFETLTDDSGNSLLGATCTVTNFPSGTLATIYNTNGTASPIANSTVVADITGQISFYVPDGAYTLTYSYKSTVYKTKSPVQMLDPLGFVAGTDIGAANAYAVTSSAYPASLYVGLKAEFKAANSNTGPSTFNLNATGNQPMTQAGGAAIVQGIIQANGLYRIEWDGAQWQLVGSQAQALFLKTAAETTAGVAIVNPAFPPMSVDRYASNTVPGTTDMTAGFNAAVHVAMIAGGEVTYGLTAPYLLLSAVNCTFGTAANQFGIRVRNLNGTAIDPANSTIIFKHNQSAGFDCTGNDNITFQDLSATTDAATFPKTGVLHARAVMVGNNSQVIRHFNSRILGKFSVACYYNYGSEDDDLFGCYFWNLNTAAGTATRIYTGNNIAAIASAFAVDPLGNPVAIRAGNQSCIDHNDYGCQDYNIAGTGTSDCIYLEQADSFKKFGGWGLSASAVANGRALVYVDMTNGTSNYGVLSGLTAEAGAFKQAFVLNFSNNARTPTGWALRDSVVEAATAALNAGALVTLDNFAVSNINSSAANSISVPGTLQNSAIDISTATSLSIGTSTRNRLTGDTFKFTVTTRTFDVWIDIGSSNKTIAVVTTSGGITSSAGALIARARIEFSLGWFRFTVLLASTSGNLAITAGSTVTLTAPGGQSLAPFDSGTATVIDQTAGTINGAAVSASGANALITIPVAVVATPHSIIIRGEIPLV